MNSKVNVEGLSADNPFAPLIGQKAQGCWLGYGNFLFLEFGELIPWEGRTRHSRGKWGLRATETGPAWRIEQDHSILAGSEDDRTRIEVAVEQINGRTLISGQVASNSGDTVLRFSDGLVLRTFVIGTEEDVGWLLRKGDSYIPLNNNLATQGESATSPLEDGGNSC